MCDRTEPALLPLAAEISRACEDADASLDEHGVPVHRLGALFDSIANNRDFKEQCWRKRPLLLQVEEFNGFFELERDVARVVDESEVSGYAVTDTTCWSYDRIAPGPEGALSAMRARCKDSTVIFIQAGGLWPKLGVVCREAQRAFGMSANINVYISMPGMAVSAPIHTDSQDVFICHTQGNKHWTVFPPLHERCFDPYGRGKLEDHLSLAQMGPPLLQLTLTPGEVLFIPAGFPHCTSTMLGQPSEQACVHLTLGLDSFAWGLSMAQLRWGVLTRLGLPSEWAPDQADQELWALMQAPLSGFLYRHDQASDAARLCEGLPKLLRRLGLQDDLAPTDVLRVVTRFLEHHERVLQINLELYESAENSRDPVAVAVGCAARAHHAAMDSLVEFCCEGAELLDPDAMDFYFAYCG